MRDSQQVPLHALGDVLHVRDALAQVGVVEALEARLQLFLHLGQRPLGVDLLFFDLLHHFVGERRIADHHGVRLEDGGVLVPHRAAHALRQIVQLHARLLQCLSEARDLRHHLLFADGDAVDRRLAPLDDHRTADGNARRNADAFVGADVAARVGLGHVPARVTNPERTGRADRVSANGAPSARPVECDAHVGDMDPV